MRFFVHGANGANADKCSAVCLAVAFMTLACVITPLHSADAESYDPPAVYLTWLQDPSTTMTVQWHTEHEGAESRIEYKEVGGEDWEAVTGAEEPAPVPTVEERLVHTVEITGLEPGAKYRFRWDEDSETYKFRTMPAELDRPIRVAIGGDLAHREEPTFPKMNEAVSRFDVDFVVFGGDLAYADGDPRHIERWFRWFDDYKNTLVAPDGRLLPHLPGIGNHEIFELRRHERDGVEHLADEWGLEDGYPTFYFTFFAFPGKPGYDVLDFGDYMSIILLDTNHYVDIAGEQTEWLESVLAERGHVPHVFPVYHVPGYPSVRDFEAATNREVREHWVPLFEENGVYAAFEHHDHAYKRTYPLLNNEIHPEGIVYLGDGSWGRAGREPGSREGAQDWFLAKAKEGYSAYIVTLYPDQFHALAIDNEGNVFDEYYRRLE